MHFSSVAPQPIASFLAPALPQPASTASAHSIAGDGSVSVSVGHVGPQAFEVDPPCNIWDARVVRETPGWAKVLLGSLALTQVASLPLQTVPLAPVPVEPVPPGPAPFAPAALPDLGGTITSLLIAEDSFDANIFVAHRENNRPSDSVLEEATTAAHGFAPTTLHLDDWNWGDFDAVNQGLAHRSKGDEAHFIGLPGKKSPFNSSMLDAGLRLKAINLHKQSGGGRNTRGAELRSAIEASDISVVASSLVNFMCEATGVRKRLMCPAGPHIIGSDVIDWLAHNEEFTEAFEKDFADSFNAVSRALASGKESMLVVPETGWREPDSALLTAAVAFSEHCVTAMMSGMAAFIGGSTVHCFGGRRNAVALGAIAASLPMLYLYLPGWLGVRFVNDQMPYDAFKLQHEPTMTKEAVSRILIEKGFRAIETQTAPRGSRATLFISPGFVQAADGLQIAQTLDLPTNEDTSSGWIMFALQATASGAGLYALANAVADRNHVHNH